MDTIVWVVEYSDEYGSTIQIYANETQAHQVAINEALEHMDNMGCNSSTIPGWADAYKQVIANKDSSFHVAIDTYNDWNHNLVSNELERYSIIVFPRKILGEFESNSSKPIQTGKLPDVPCKVCHRNVNESESTCWFCGVDNPARK